MKKFILVAFVVALYAVSALLDLTGLSRDITLTLITFVAFISFLVYRSYRHRIIREDLLLGIPVYILVVLVISRKLDFIDITDIVLWAVVALSSILSVGYLSLPKRAG